MTREGTVTVEEQCWILTFERELKHPIEEVWAKLTDTTQMRDWLSKDATLEPRAGGVVQMRDHHIDSTVVAYEPPRLLEFGWSGPLWEGGTVRWELEPSAAGTRVVLRHRMPMMSESDAKGFMDRYPYDLPEGWEPLPSTLAGWHSMLDALDTVLAGTTPSEDMGPWLELNRRYKDRIGATRS
jgi:uncharacterized protein YndB with AHSA1/START domain